jgi:peptidyl-prolyl cis-trans isomerase SurA
MDGIFEEQIPGYHRRRSVAIFARKIKPSLMRFLFASALCSATVFGSALFAQPVNTPVMPANQVDGIAAVIGKEIVLHSEVYQQKEALDREFAQSGQTPPSLCAVFSEMVVEKLLLHHAEIDSVVVSDAEVDDAIARRIEQLAYQIGSQKKLEEYYKKSILEIKEDLRPLMKNQMTAQRMQSTLTEKVELTPKDVADFVKQIQADSLPLINAEVEYAQLCIKPRVSTASKEEAIDRLKSLKARIERGSSFASMAILYSEDPGSNKAGGEYKGIKRGQFVKEFEAIAFNLKPGEVSDPFETEYGFHICQVQTKRGEELDMRHILIKPRVEEADVERAANTLDSLRSALVSGTIAWRDAVARFSDDKPTSANGGIAMNPNTADTKWDLADLNADLLVQLDQVDSTGLSPVALYREPDGTMLFRVVKRINRTEPHRANLGQDFTKLKALAENQKRNEVFKLWIKDKGTTTYIRIDPVFHNCPLPL